MFVTLESTHGEVVVSTKGIVVIDPSASDKSCSNIRYKSGHSVVFLKGTPSEVAKKLGILK